MSTSAPASGGPDRGAGVGAGGRGWLGLVFAGALVVRLVVLWSWQRGPLASCLGTDPEYFYSAARRIAAGGWAEPHGLLTGGPLYPYFLGGLVALLGPATGPLRVVQALVGAAGTTLVAALGERLHGQSTGVLAAIGTLLYGPLLASELGFENEFLAVPLAAGALLLLSADAPRRFAHLGAGVLLGMMATLRGNQLLVAVLAGGWLLLTLRPWRLAAERTLLLALGAALAVAPVAIRNLAAVGEAIPLSAHGGYVFYLGNHEGASWRYAPLEFGDTNVGGEAPAAVAEARRRSGRALTPGEASSFWLGEGLRYVAAHPGAALRNAAWKALAFFQDGELPDNYDVRFLSEQVPPLRALRLSLGVVLPLAAIGLLGPWTRRRALLLLPTCAALLTAVAFYYNARFRLPAVPFLVVLAADGARRLVGWARERDLRRLARAGIAATAGVSLVAVAPSFRDDFYFPWITLADCSASSHPARAEALYRRALALHPKEPEARLGLAALLAARRDGAEARALLAPLPRNAPALALLGSIAAGEGRTEEAARWLEEAVGRDPSMVGAWNDLGVLYATAGRSAEALAALEQALSLAPDRADVRANAEAARALAEEGAPAPR